MSTAEGLARLRDASSVTTIGERLLEGRQGWAGVEPHLVAALRAIGGAEAEKLVAEFESKRR